MFCTVKHRPILKCGKNTAKCLWKRKPLPVLLNYVCYRWNRQLTQAVNCAHGVTTKMEVFEGCCLKHPIRPILHFFIPLRYDYPFDATLVLWQYESRIRGGLLYKQVCIFIVNKQHLWRPANRRRWPNYSVMLVQRLQCGPNIKKALVHYLVFAGRWWCVQG